MSCMLFGRTVATRIHPSCRLYSYKVANDLERSTFYITLEKNNEAFLKYSINPNRKVINLEHTFVPDAGRGKGIAKLLAKAAFDYAIDNNLMIKTECDYTAKYYRDNATQYEKYMLQ